MTRTDLNLLRRWIAARVRITLRVPRATFFTFIFPLIFVILLVFKRTRIGLDIRVGSQTTIGSSFRTLVMGNFDYDPSKLDMGWGVPPSKNELFAASPDVATQVQFYLRREL